jgi:serine/threonine-protein kinase
MEIDVGRVIAGKYELVRLLGRGAMGEVWVAHHTTLGEHVAIKLLTRPPEGDPLEDPSTAAARFRFEAQVAARLSRKTRHIVRVTDHGEEEGLPYLVMELLEGETLEALLVRDGRLALELVTTLVGQIGRALAQAHAEGVFHRDLKPANVFLLRDEEGNLLAKVLDFGIARAIHAHHRAQPTAFATAKGIIFGTPSYMSPEQARGSARLDHRCDLWALATMAYEGVSGDLPVDGADTEQLIQNLCAGRVVPLRARSPGMPAALDAFFARAFSEQIAERFQTAAELVQGFESAAGVSPAARAVGTSTEDRLVESTPGSVLDRQFGTETTGPLRRRTRARVAVLAAAAALLVSAVAGVAWRSLARPASSAGRGAPVAHSVVVVETAAPAAVVPLPTASATSAQPAEPVPVSALPHAHSSRALTRPTPPNVPLGSAFTSSPVTPPAVPVQAPPKKIDKSEVF